MNRTRTTRNLSAHPLTPSRQEGRAAGRNHGATSTTSPSPPRGGRAGPGGATADRLSIRQPVSASRRAFTLVEMLVAVALVVLMMTLFATIFQMSTDAMGTQKALAENDQKVRLVLTVLRGDLKNRTMKLVAPFYAGEDAAPFFAAQIDLRQGYFYVGENDRDDETDDTLQFTVQLPGGDDRFFGHATPFTASIIFDPNQPEFDDGVPVANNAAASRFAEICYFVRRGTLYRRVMLIREPIIGDANPLPGQTGMGPGTYGPMGEYASGTKNFYSEQDLSARFTGTVVSVNGFDQVRPNSVSAFPLGKPNCRFGFNHNTGLPREYVGGDFIGRFTHWETSYLYNPAYNRPPSNFTQFGYPARIDNTECPNPMDPTAATLTYDANAGLVTSYIQSDASGRYVSTSRTSEDVLATNVLRFDIKLFDDAASAGPDGLPGVAGVDDNTPLNGVDDQTELGWPGSDDGDFRDIGHNGATGIFSSGACNMTQGGGAYCNTHPTNGSILWRFDTWHYDVNLDQTGGSGDPPPFAGPVDVPAGQPNAGYRRGVRAIQIRIAFIDPTSQQTREVTFVQSLAPTN